MAKMREQFVVKMKGEARVRLIDQSVIDECRRMHPDWPHDEIRRIALNRVVSDTGWQSNTITDFCRRAIAGGNSLDAAVRIFIHKGTNPASTFVSALSNTYSSQSPDQVRIPDSTVLDAATLVQTRTVQYSAPAVSRNINIVGLTFSSSTDTGAKYVTDVIAYTLLSSTVVQSTSQTADVQYRVTFSLDGT